MLLVIAASCGKVWKTRADVWGDTKEIGWLHGLALPQALSPGCTFAFLRESVDFKLSY